jgi:predicted amidohydrolase/ribosomal protein S18 acetylase RimI-like enzyme
MSKNSATQPTLFVRNSTVADFEQIMALYHRVYPNFTNYTHEMLLGQVNNFPQGQFVAIYEGKVVGFCCTFRISAEVAMKPHTWDEITGNGYASRHDPKGQYLYGMELFVDPACRGLRIGQRLYNERKKLCQFMRLAGIVFGGRLPGLARKLKEAGSAESYVSLVQQKKMRDPVLSFQLRNGFEIIGVLANYVPSDSPSLGYAAHLVWHNPQVQQQKQQVDKAMTPGQMSQTVRIATVQYMQRRISSFEEFAGFVEYFVDVVADYKADFVVFPELFTLQLLSIENAELTPAQSIAALTKHTAKFKETMSDLALRYNVNIIGGSHPTQTAPNTVQNICYVFLRDGSVHEQVKIHPTPNERFWWNIKGGSEVRSIMTDCGPIGIMICYDAEFPELARHLVNQGALILFVPFCTDERQSYLRVRYCSQARAVENQCFVVLSGNVGNLPGVNNMDIQYAQSCILTPCDFPFARDGIAAETTENVETVAIADLPLENLTTARNAGTVQNLKDRRFDLYSVQWK